jgi:CubicO group peptidase (beta-lactamase class C family)
MSFADLADPPADAAWRPVAPTELGFDRTALDEAVAFAQAHETAWDRDLGKQIASGMFEPAPYNEILGPTGPRGPVKGLILRHGRIAAEWGETTTPEMTFSVAKSYLSALAGIAWADKLIGDLDEPIGARVKDGGFEGPHNGAITWRHLLQQASEWEGTLWDKPDWIDRGRVVGGAEQTKSMDRKLQAPGQFWEYNDIRVNRLSLALLRLFRRPLPEVAKERLMDPIGCSSDWRWEGYRNSWVEIDGPGVQSRRVQSVPGGGHWGGGMFIHARDQARFGQLYLNRGRWNGAEILPKRWIEDSLKPCPIERGYGFMWWLNAGGRLPSAPAESFMAVGAGGNLVYVDPSREMVVVARWLDTNHQDGFIQLVQKALKA